MAAPTPILSDDLERHVRTLSSDSFEGREPGTTGEAETIKYVAGEFARAGLSPIGSDFSQAVPITASSATPKLVLRSSSGSLQLDGDRDIVIQAPHDLVLQDEQVIFAGYGITAPEFRHDDYAGVDVSGKVVIVLPGEPAGFPARARSALEPRALDTIAEEKRTYHQWFWMKHLNARRHGAKAVFILSPDDRLTTRRRYFQQDFMLPSSLPPWAPPLSGFLSERLFKKGGSLGVVDLDYLQSLAVSPRFRAAMLPFRLSGTATVKSRQFISHNVVGKIAGSGPGCVVMTAHWDGYGRDAKAQGDNVWNGAVDDAGGVSQLIEIARRLAKLGKPRRSIYFVAVTGEERGFLGSRHFVANSPCHPSQVAAVLNLDWFYELGRTSRFGNHGLGYSSLDEIIDRLVREGGRTVTGVNAYYAGGDQLPFMLAGIPGFHGGSVSPLIDYPSDHEKTYYERREAQAVSKEGNSNEDEIRPEWDLRGAVEDAELILKLAWTVANDPSEPCWKVASLFTHPSRLCASITAP